MIQRKRVRDFLNEPDTDLIYIHDYGYQEFPNRFTKCIFYTRNNNLIILYAHQGIEDEVTKEFIEKIISLQKAMNPIYVGELKTLL
jgi:hypothetical protein